MAGAKEYEYIAYPKLNHVKAGFVDITFRMPHIHREMEIGLVLDGSGVMTISNKKIQVGPGSIYFINANEAHDIVTGGPTDLRVAYLQISNHFCEGYLQLFRNLEVLESDLTAALSPEKGAVLEELFLNAVKAYLENGDLSMLNCMEAVCHLFRWLLENVPYRCYEESQYRSMKRKMARLTRITEYIDMHYSERIVLSDLAAREDISETYLSHFIRQNLNMSFQDYVNNLRLERAVQLILHGNMNLTDVSLECGFSDVKYMNRLFQKRFGCMPREFRLTHRTEAVQKSAETELQSYASENMGLIWLEEYQKKKTA